MTTEQAKQIKTQQKELIAKRAALNTALTVFTTVFNGNIEETMKTAGMPADASWAQVEAEYNRIDKAIKDLPKIPFNVFTQIKNS